jgi:hypothetical protein
VSDKSTGHDSEDNKDGNKTNTDQETARNSNVGRRNSKIVEKEVSREYEAGLGLYKPGSVGQAPPR